MRNSERVKSVLGNDDLDLTDVPFKAPNSIMQHPNKHLAPTPEKCRRLSMEQPRQK
jgi:hypothetical protein